MNKRWSRRSTAGFTLLELLLVVLVVGILASLALPQYTNFAEKARAAEALSTIGAIKTAEELVKLESGSYTSNSSHLSITLPTGSTTYWTYNITSADATSFNVTATRTDKKATTEPPKNQTISFLWNNGSETWSGTHTGVPK